MLLRLREISKGLRTTWAGPPHSVLIKPTWNGRPLMALSPTAQFQSTTNMLNAPTMFAKMAVRPASTTLTRVLTASTRIMRKSSGLSV
ncbi:hypothetical protein FQN60_017883 [Etheostoma spectabile]|uniref:Uncharacterized protein n=1 Tax=Etheostoma spectabile TaxID=54343 RepID=A0A5J5DGJ6_9PERO|nr:hypothetical protein FQN60_017883 [Etheostoma spectabile]